MLTAVKQALCGCLVPLPPVCPLKLRQAERLGHGGGGDVLGGGIQVGVDVHGGADVAVAQPFLDQLGVDAVFQQQGRAAVADSRHKQSGGLFVSPRENPTRSAANLFCRYRQERFLLLRNKTDSSNIRAFNSFIYL